MRKFIIIYPDTSISVVTVVDSSTNEEIISKCPKYQTNTSYRDIVDADIPETYRDMREAWEDTQPGTQIDISHQKAKDCMLTCMREIRDAELCRLDTLTFKAEETSDTTLLNSVLADKQTLRDCTNDLKAITDTGHNDTLILDDIRAKAQLPTINN